jgi:hypothetical protein
MCLQCHRGISDEHILQELNSLIDNKFDTNEFKLINSTSISHFIIAASGYNGTNIKNLSIKVLEKYNNWLMLNSNKTINTNLSYDKILNIISYLKHNSTESYNLDNLVNYLNKLNNLNNNS